MTTQPLNKTSIKKDLDDDISLGDLVRLCSQHLDAIIYSAKEAARSYNDDIPLGNKQFLETMGMLNLFIELVISLHRFLKDHAEIQGASRKILQNLEVHLLSIIKALVSAQEKQDIVMLCDLLEYELTSNLTQWKIKAIPMLKQSGIDK